MTALNTFSQEVFGANILRQVNYKNFHLLLDVISNYRLVYAFKGDQVSANQKFSSFVEQINNPNILSIHEKRGNLTLDTNSEIN